MEVRQERRAGGKKRKSVSNPFSTYVGSRLLRENIQAILTGKLCGRPSKSMQIYYVVRFSEEDNICFLDLLVHVNNTSVGNFQ